MAMQASRQPSSRMMSCNQGNIKIEPTPAPENASPVASPRRRTNQKGIR